MIVEGAGEGGLFFSDRFQDSPPEIFLSDCVSLASPRPRPSFGLGRWASVGSPFIGALGVGADGGGGSSLLFGRLHMEVSRLASSICPIVQAFGEICSSNAFYDFLQQLPICRI